MRANFTSLCFSHIQGYRQLRDSLVSLYSILNCLGSTQPLTLFISPHLPYISTHTHTHTPPLSKLRQSGTALNTDSKGHVRTGEGDQERSCAHGCRQDSSPKALPAELSEKYHLPAGGWWLSTKNAQPRSWESWLTQQTIGSHRVGHDWCDLAAAVADILRP